MLSAPSFLTSHTVDLEVCGRALKFYPASPKVIAKLLEEVGAQATAVLTAAQAGADVSGPLGELVQAVGRRVELAATLVLDALRDENWVKRPVQPQAAQAFLNQVDTQALLSMLGAVAKVNREAFGANGGPFAGLLAKTAGASESAPTQAAGSS